MQFGTGNQKNNVFCLLIRQSFVIFVKMKTADGTFGYGHCREHGRFILGLETGGD